MTMVLGTSAVASTKSAAQLTNHNNHHSNLLHTFTLSFSCNANEIYDTGSLVATEFVKAFQFLRLVDRRSEPARPFARVACAMPANPFCLNQSDISAALAFSSGEGAETLLTSSNGTGDVSPLVVSLISVTAGVWAPEITLLRNRKSQVN